MRAHAQRRLVFTVALGAVLLAAQLSAFNHQLFVQHVTCVEHGEQIHVEGAPAAVPGAEPAVTASATAAGHGHDHCSVFLARREEQAPVSAPALELPEGPAVERPVVEARSAGLPSPVALLRLAPKGSPPTQG